MTIPNFSILLVDDPAASAGFYERLLRVAPVEASPTFAMFVLPSGLKLGLWSRHTVEPAASGQPGASELVFIAADAAEVDATHADWRGRGLVILQPPADLDFGRTFLAADPDGHRLRVYARAAA